MQMGVVIGADRNSEWLLPWFWERYTTTNRLPLAIIDMGMSHGARSFCMDKGEVIELQMPKLPTLSSQLQGWFKKPFACLQTPFEKSLWLDCDCEVLKSLDPLFSLDVEIALALDTENSHLKEIELGTIAEGEVLYNSGVILYQKTSPILTSWAKKVTEEKSAFFSDQHVLSRLIKERSYPVHPLHEDYNWRMSQGMNFNASIIHWAGSWGKEYIRKYGGLAHELAALPKI